MNTCGKTSIIVTVWVTALLSGCASGDLESYPSSTEVVEPPPPSVVEPRGPVIAEGCTSDLPYGLDFAPDTPQEAEAVAGLSGCTDGQRTLMRNASSSEVVWTVRQPAGLGIQDTVPDWRPDIAIFRSVLAARDGSVPVLEPGITLELPYPPRAIHLDIDQQVQTLWASEHLVTDQLVDQFKDKAPDLLAPNSPVGRAAMTCGLAGYDIGAGLSDVADPAAELTEKLGLGAELVTSGAGCASAIREAEEQATTVEHPVSLNGARVKAQQLRTGGWWTGVLKAGRQAVPVLLRQAPK